MTRILFTDKEHAWAVQKMEFDLSGVTDPIPLERVVFSSKHEWNWLTVDDILKRTVNDDTVQKHEKFWEILETLRTMESIHKMLYLYMRGSSHIATSQINIRDEVKAVELLQLWIRFANKLELLLGSKNKIEISDRLILKIARETVPTLFAMPKELKANYYDDTKSVIIQLSPYEDNTKALSEKKLGKKCVMPKNKVKKFLKETVQQ